MRTVKISLFIKAAFLLIAVISLSTCNTSKKATSQADAFKIPKKIINAEDLPQPVQKKAPAEVHYVQLFPDEKPPVETQTVAQEIKPAEAEPAPATKEILVVSDEIEKHVQDVISEIVENRQRPMFYHIVSGSFRNKILADRFAEHLKNIGYGNTYVRFFDNGFNRVIVQRYVNEVEARQYLQGYRSDNPSYADAWLYYNKNDVSDEPLAIAAK